MKNIDIREKAEQKRVYLYEIALELGISDVWLSKKLRKELPAEEKEKIFGIIEKLAKK